MFRTILLVLAAIVVLLVILFFAGIFEVAEEVGEGIDGEPEVEAVE